MTTVLRWENAEGHGPYNSCNGGKSPASDFNHIDKEHPVPFEDGLTIKYGIHRCGFKDIVQANAWFNSEEQRVMTKAGFKLVERKASSVEYGKKQVIFVPYVEAPEIDMSVEF